MITQPQEDIKLPADVKAKVEAVRNNITVMEAEVNRLKGIVVAEEYTVGELGKQKAELTEQIASLEKIKADAIKEIDNLAGEGEILASKLTKLQDEATKVLAEKESFEAEVDLKEKELDERESGIIEREQEVADKETELKDKEELLNEKQAKIGEFIKQIN